MARALQPATRMVKRGRGHSYLLDGEKCTGVTTVLSNGIPKGALVGWAAGAVANFTADRLTKGPDGHIYADDLVDDLAEIARTSGKNWPKRFSPTKVAEVLKGEPYRDRDAAGNRGTEVHGLAQRLAEGDEVEVPDELVGHVDAYLLFREEWQPVDELLELVVVNRTCRYMGKFDLIATLCDGQRWLLDLKTNRSGPFGEVGLQLAAYRHAETYLDPETGEEHPMPEVDRCGAVWLRADGYDLYPFEAGPTEFQLFRHAQMIAWFTDEHAKTLKGEALTPGAVA